MKSRQKLHNSRGASLLMALLVVLVVMMVSVVILSAASANAGRLKRNQAEEQAYLTVSSAARLMRDSIADNAAVKYVLNTTVVTQYTDDEGNVSYVTDDQGATHVADTLPFGTVINSLMDGVTKNTAKKSFVIAVPNMGDVQVDAVMSTTDKDKYSITALLYLAGQPDSNCCVQLICSGKYEKTVTSTENTTTTVESVTWTSPKLTKGEMPTPTATPAP